MSNPTEIVTAVLVLDTNIYASGDILADTQGVGDALSGDLRSGILQTVTVIDKDDQGAAFDIWILDAMVSFGTVNSAPSITDANAANIMGRVQVGTGDYYDLGGVRVAYLTQLAMPIRAIPSTRDIAIAVVNGAGTPTYSASGVVIRFGILRDQKMA